MVKRTLITKMGTEEAVVLSIRLECPFCEDAVDDYVYFFKYNNKIMITCSSCGETLTEYLGIKFLDMSCCNNAGQCESCVDKFRCYTTRGERDEAD